MIGIAGVAMTPLVADPNLKVNLLMESGGATFEGGVPYLTLNATDFMLSLDGISGVKYFLVYMPSDSEAGSFSMQFYDTDPGVISGTTLVNFTGTHHPTTPVCPYVTTGTTTASPAGCPTVGFPKTLCVRNCDASTTPPCQTLPNPVWGQIFSPTTGLLIQCEFMFTGGSGTGVNPPSACISSCPSGGISVYLPDRPLDNTGFSWWPW